MHYFGGKNRTCKEISTIINENICGRKFLSPFIGAGWVESLVLSNKKECYDKHPYLIAMYKELQKGWKPPNNVSEEEYLRIKNNIYECPYLSGFVGFGCSFSGKWWGGYARDNTGRNYCLNAKNSIMEKMIGLKNAKFDCKDYKELNPVNCFIYCDPPYSETTQYSKKDVGDFDSREFWDIMRVWSKNNTVVISEYEAPEDFQYIWAQNTKLDIRDSDNKRQGRVEKVFSLNLKKTTVEDWL